jgi:hypothetical protein
VVDVLAGPLAASPCSHPKAHVVAAGVTFRAVGLAWAISAAIARA